MTILGAWKNSLTLFKPSECKKFFAAFIAAEGRIYTTWLKRWWWLIALYLAGGLYGFYSPLDNLSTPFAMRGFFRLVNSFALPEIIASLLLVLLYVTIYLSAKQTSMAKDYAYFTRYKAHTVVLTLWFLAVSVLYWVVGNSLRFIHPPHVGMSLAGLAAVIGIVFTSCYIVVLLNVEEINMRSWRNAFVKAIKMTVYNLPFSLIMGLVVCGLYVLTIWGIIEGSYFFWKSFISFSNVIGNIQDLSELEIVELGRAMRVLQHRVSWTTGGGSYMIIDLLLVLPAIVALATALYTPQLSRD